MAWNRSLKDGPNPTLTMTIGADAMLVVVAVEVEVGLLLLLFVVVWRIWLVNSYAMVRAAAIVNIILKVCP